MCIATQHSLVDIGGSSSSEPPALSPMARRHNVAEHEDPSCSTPLQIHGRVCHSPSSPVPDPPGRHLYVRACTELADEDTGVGGQSRMPREAAGRAEGDEGWILPHTREICTCQPGGAAPTRCPLPVPDSDGDGREAPRKNAK